ncbi:MAG: TPM domain-containing protein [Bacteroidia bacterium]|nr:TPM domain-containing protein [Bacteroidia bacterium]
MNSILNKYIRPLFITTALLLLIASVAIAQVPQRPQPPKLVNDLAGILTPSQVSAMEQRLVSFDDTTSNQIAVVIVPQLYGYDKAQLAYTIGQEWGVGNKETNNGLVILVKPKVGNSKGEVFIATGYGLEGVVTDALSRRVVERDMIPYFKVENYYGGINAALNRLLPIIAGEISVKEDEQGSLIPSIMFLLFIIAFIWIVSSSGKNNTKNIGGGGGRRNFTATDAFILGSILGSSGSSRSSGGSYGGGSFGGGGFGGFGGGSFGGGGAGGSW